MKNLFKEKVTKKGVISKMYYILNETKQIIAADDHLLTLCGVAHIDELSSNIVRGDTTFDLSSKTSISIKTVDKEHIFDIEEISLSSLLGHLTLVNITTEEKVSITAPIALEDENNALSDLLMPEEEDEETALLLLGEPTKNITLNGEEIEEPVTFEEPIISDDNLMLLNDNVDFPIVEEISEKEDEKVDDSELFDLLGEDLLKDEPSTTDTVEQHIQDFNEDHLQLDSLVIDAEETDISEIHIDIEKNSQIIGISTEDYTHFFNEFIDTALNLEKDLQSQNSDTRTNAIDTLSHLSDVLHLPTIGNIITKIDHAQDDEQAALIESFYNTLARLTTSKNIDKEIEKISIDMTEDETLEEEATKEESLKLFDESISINTPTIQEEIKAKKTNTAESFGTISLEGIKPKHFDFQLEEAANDLSLPVELIEEFVHDFIEQAHIETKKMLEAYENGDLDTIQKIGHLLKGASSNLRINALSDTLYKIQFCEDPKNLENLIKDYWAHFLSFEHQINVISN